MEHLNVSPTERVICGVAGPLLCAFGMEQLYRRKWYSGVASCVIGAGLFKRGLTGRCELYKSLGIGELDDTKGLPVGASVKSNSGIKIEKRVVVERPIDALFQYWKNYENLPRIMPHLESVKDMGGNRSHWVAKTRSGLAVEWDVEMINEKENEVLAWKSLAGSQIDTAGSVRFIDIPGEGTELRINLKYDPPGGKMVAAIAKFFGQNVGAEIEADLIRFKQTMEAGTGRSTLIPSTPKVWG